MSIAAVLRRLRPTDLRGSGTVIVCRTITVGFALLYVKIYTAYLTTLELGTFFYITTLAYTVNALVLVPYDFYFQSRLAKAGDVLDVETIWRLSSKILLIALGFAAILSGLLAWFGKVGSTDILGIYLNALTLYLCTAARGLLNNRGQKIFVSLMLVLEAAARAAAFVLAARFFTPTGRLLNYSGIAALSVELVIIAAYARKTLQFGRTPDPFEPLPVVLRTSYPLSISAVCNVLQLQSFRLLYPWFGAPATAATYAVVANIGAAGMSAAGSIYSQIFMPRIYTSHGSYFGTYVRNALFLFVGVLAGGLIFRQQIIGLATHAGYTEYASLISFGILVEACNLLTGATALVLMFHSATSKLLKVNIGAAAISLVGQGVALHLMPSSPYVIGYAIAVTQLIVVTVLIFHASRAIESANKAS